MTYHDATAARLQAMGRWWSTNRSGPRGRSPGWPPGGLHDQLLPDRPGFEAT